MINKDMKKSSEEDEERKKIRCL